MNSTNLKGKAISRAAASLGSALLICLTVLHPAWGAFREIGWGVRPEGMGGAFTAVANDANTIAYNPAGTVLTNKAQVAFAYTKPFAGLGSTVDLGLFYSAFARSINHHLGYGLAWTRFSSPNLTENSLLFNFAINPGEIFEWKRDLIFGINVKRMSRSFALDQRTASDPVFAQGNDKTVYAFDLGAWTKPLPVRLPGLSLGMNLKNFNEPDAGLRTEDLAHLESVLGFAYRLHNTLFAFDLSRRNSVQTFRGGAETWFFNNQLGLRAGGSSSNGSLGVSYRYPFGKNSIILDYAFIMPFFVQETAGTHRISFALHR